MYTVITHGRELADRIQIPSNTTLFMLSVPASLTAINMPQFLTSLWKFMANPYWFSDNKRRLAEGILKFEQEMIYNIAALHPTAAQLHTDIFSIYRGKKTKESWINNIQMVMHSIGTESWRMGVFQCPIQSKLDILQTAYITHGPITLDDAIRSDSGTGGPPFIVTKSTKQMYKFNNNTLLTSHFMAPDLKYLLTHAANIGRTHPARRINMFIITCRNAGDNRIILPTRGLSIQDYLHSYKPMKVDVAAPIHILYQSYTYTEMYQHARLDALSHFLKSQCFPDYNFSMSPIDIVWLITMKPHTIIAACTTQHDTKANIVYVWNVCVHYSYRNNKLSNKLLNYMERSYPLNTKFVVYVHITNYRAEQLYMSRGYKRLQDGQVPIVENTFAMGKISAAAG